MSNVNSNNLEFLPYSEKLNELRITNGKIVELNGLEHCKNLKEIDLRWCKQLRYGNSILSKLSQLEVVLLYRCGRYHDINVEELKLRKIISGLD